MGRRVDFRAVAEGQPQVQVVEVLDPLDLAPVKAGLAAYDKEIDQMVQTAAAHEVTNDETNRVAVEMAGQAKKLWKAIESKRTAIVGPANDFVKAVNNLAKTYQGRLDQLERGLKGKIGQYQGQVELERRRQEEAARKAHEEAQLKMDQEAKAAGVEPVQLQAPVLPRSEGPIRTEAGKASTHKVWKFEIEDEDQVPREYLTVDEKKIRQAVHDGVRQIAGINIFQKTEVQITT